MKTLLKHKRLLCALFALALAILPLMVLTISASAADGEAAPTSTEGGEPVEEAGGTIGMKALAAGAAVGIAAAGGAVAMGMATAKSTESISRQPEAEGKIRTTLMLGLVFIETAIIYALLVVILIIFVL